MSDLSVLAARLTEGQRGLLTVDQPAPRLDELLRRARIEGTEANRRGLRELVLAAPGLDRVVAGVLVDPATLEAPRPPLLARRAVPIGVGCAIPPGGVDFARRRWTVGPASTPPEVEEGTRRLAEWAADRQRDGVVPLVECVVRVGERDTMATAALRHTDALRPVLTALDGAGVDRAGCLLGVGLPLPGHRARDVATSDDVARASRACLREARADGIAGVVFAAPGQPGQLAGHLVAMRWLSPDWPIGFRLGADTLADVARIWRGRPQLVAAAQRELMRQLGTMSRTLCGAGLQ